MGIVALMFAFSCEKEQEIQEANTVTGKENPEVLPPNVPETITATLVDTKTSYNESGAFSWATGEDGDHIYLMFYKEDTHRQGWIEYKATSADGNGKAIFTIVASQGDRIAALEGYANSGVAVYGQGSDKHVARPYTDNNEACTLYKPDGEHTVSYDPFLTLRQSLTGASSEVVLLGTGIGDANATTGTFTDYHFYTACAVLKVTVSGIPDNASELRLCTADKVNYPLSGDFAITYIRAVEKPAAPELTKDSYRQWKNGSVYTDTSADYIAAAWDGSSTTQTFYFNVPTGEYPANTLSLKLVDTGGNALLEKTITAAYTFNRNDLVPASFANEWVTLGTGKYADYWMQGYNGVVEDMWDVTIQQSTTDKRYRIVNPYAQGVNMPQTLAHDDYLYFSISGEGTVTFTDCITGVKASGYDSSTERNLKLVYVHTDKNTILAGDASTPKVIQLSPRYEQAGNSSWNWPRNGKPHLVRIVMPDYVSTYTTSITSKTDATNGNFSASATNAPVYTRFFISASNFPKAIYDAGSTDFNATTTKSPFDVCWSDKTGTYNNTYSAANMASRFTSGKLYICWITYSGSTIYTIGTKPFYFLLTADQTALVGTYSFTSIQALFYYYRTAWTDVKSQDVNNLVLSASDNALKGNIQITKIFGFDKSGGTSSYVVNGPIGGATSTLTGTFTSGYGAYGTYTNSSSSMVFTDDDTTPFMNYNGNGVFVRGVTHNNKVSTTNKSFGFTYSKDETTATLTASPAALMELWMGEKTNYNADRSVIYVTNNSSFTPTALVATRSLE